MGQMGIILKNETPSSGNNSNTTAIDHDSLFILVIFCIDLKTVFPLFYLVSKYSHSDLPIL